ncbi:MAG: 16S rRNA (cytosine(1402)-N(4))-methyltransferase [Elusimicrobia bacterium HGW-Elusimicrobia-1]|jgi:16S rRNA (cytosine1402-N4)-methyltransferase|nr:MAG: 16S rRNA (cytosine(1402)-N(4))-methyltransferase [Elusimicrobia bacterium HGW-Elusimicrobia-1]
MKHIPVLVEEIVNFLSPVTGGFYVDATLGTGGHSRRILESCPDARVTGMDVDPAAVALAVENLKDFGGRFTAVTDNYRNIAAVTERFGKADGILADLGMSSLQLDDPSRGFSFGADGVLDMRMSPRLPLTAADVVNKFPADELERIFREYGDERYARRIAGAVASERKSRAFCGAADFAAFVASKAPRGRGGIHPATRVFQALRIYVNSELDNLDALLAAAPAALKSGGRLAVISFHSKEDGAVKRAFKSMAADGTARLLTKKPVRPSDGEIASNPRSRSAKLRVMEKI